jgi:hypothetical protein
MQVADPLELGSFLLMLYAGMIGLYVTRRAARVGFPLVFLPLLLSLMILFHGIHHLAAYLGYPVLEDAFEFGASAFALALAVAYAYIWGR